MANTYTLISSNVLTGSAASVTFSSIPSTYTDLVLRLSTRSANAGDGVGPFNITFNGSGGTAYSRTNLQGNGSAASSNRQSSVGYIAAGLTEYTAYAANTFSSNEIYIPNYTVAQNKPVGSISAVEDNATAAFINAIAGLWQNTSTITSITLDGVTFASGSSFYLYGISKS